MMMTKMGEGEGCSYGRTRSNEWGCYGELLISDY